MADLDHSGVRHRRTLEEIHRLLPETFRHLSSLSVRPADVLAGHRNLLSWLGAVLSRMGTDSDSGISRGKDLMVKGLLDRTVAGDVDRAVQSVPWSS